jgi:hypothetical protein
MPPLTARDTVQRLVAREQADAGTADAMAIAERAARRLGHELVGWFGPFATQTLVSRALTHARAEHPALEGVRVGTAAAPFLERVADSARVHGADATAAGIVDVMAWVVQLLGRLIGDDLATAVLEQSVRRSAVGPPRPDERVPDDVTDGGAAGGGTRDTGDTTGSTTDD